VLSYYTREIDAGCGRQNILVKDGTIVKQYLIARSGYYTGVGNPELLGQPESCLTRRGFKRVHGPQVFDALYNRWTSAEIDNDDVETELD
jgi:hypothetical protein